ncbi:MAG: D-Ala-D-Ala carboxypeptidase family metallohydrolase [Paracoccus sp. (in: a-proteobacteria)]|nr:D-Ala-D-Ala carboxypeptidase family metallohydrolase [Paracoccus sp. (in: a-proteobacteria)]
MPPFVRVRGAKRSKHLEGTDFDTSMANHDQASFEKATRAEGFLGFGTYPRSGFMHIDQGPARRWGAPFPPRPIPEAIVRISSASRSLPLLMTRVSVPVCVFLR